MKSKKKILILGLPLACDILKNILKENYEIVNAQSANYFEIVKKILKCDIVFYISGGFDIKIWFWAWFFNKRRICHWAGTDSQIKLASINNKVKGFVSKIFIQTYTSGSKNIYENILKSHYRLKTQVLELTIIDEFEVRKYIKQDKKYDKHRILIYLAPGREFVYKYNLMYKIIKKYYDTEFYIVGHNGSDLPHFENLIYLGKLKREELFGIYNEITILIRITINDGIAGMVQEALAFGKEVIFNYDIPLVHKACTMGEIEEILMKLLEKKPEINILSQKKAFELYSYKKFIDNFNKVLK